MTGTEKIRDILNLKTNESIGDELAERQLEVITKAYNYLSKPGNNIIYIADEVGLGKTYIAAGIALLLRHFSPDLVNHRDVIIVPKKNLQTKWKRELSNFIKNNYRVEHDVLKSQFELSRSIKEKVFPVSSEDPISIFRMTSFSSVASNRNSKSDLRDNLITSIFRDDPFATEIITKALHFGYFKKGNEGDLRKLVGYLLNALSPKINCVIVDEAHNYKHGLGDDSHDGSIRNEVTARFLGSVKEARILNEFPGLATKVKTPLAEKIICLSATPKDRNLLEIKRQFNCFTNNHCLEAARTPEDVKSLLKSFLIRGNLEYKIQGKQISRNQCRHEHRLGNINKSADPSLLSITDGFESLFWQLLQYKSLKHLNLKNNSSFEIGMLAGFESYQLDVDKMKIKNELDEEVAFEKDKEYEMTAHRKEKKSQDFNVVNQIINSFSETFKSELPPHPKLSQLESEIVQQLERQEKSLIFVRRVASAYEIEKRILSRYEKNIIIGKQLNFSGKYKKFKVDSVEKMIQRYEKRDILVKLTDFFDLLMTKDEIILCIKKVYPDYSEKIEEIRYWFRFCYENDQGLASLIDNFILEERKNISSDLKKVVAETLPRYFADFQKMLVEADEEFVEEQEVDSSGYFFLDYFKRGQAGYPYRAKMYRETWFEIELNSFVEQFGFLSYDASAIVDIMSESGKKGKSKKHRVFLNQQEALQNYLRENATLNLEFENVAVLRTALKDSSFLTILLINHCYQELNEWLQKRLLKQTIGEIINDIIILNSLIKSVFRNGSGLLSGFVADGQKRDFTDSLLELIVEKDAPFHFVLEEIKTIIKDFDFLISINFPERDKGRIDKTLRDLIPVVGTTGQDDIDRGMLATRFRMPGFPYVLVTTDIFREGEDLHSYCQNIYHYGIAWNPSDMEQRTGRIDRINSFSYRKLIKENKLDFDNKVQIFYPYLSQSVEVNQVAQLLKNINIFIETFNEIEIQNNYETSVSINGKLQRSDIPQQIVNRLKSLYDVDNFNPD